ncbi:hypothetical protein [Actinomadura sp. 9N407]|uniref:hypothetical protein n=1 Tax=Actinomadura sp. 9N407 TaxID=3375154 RepID=UPI0037991B22
MGKLSLPDASAGMVAAHPEVAQARVLLRLVYDEAMRRGGIRARRVAKIHVLADRILNDLDDQPV